MEAQRARRQELLFYGSLALMAVLIGGDLAVSEGTRWPLVAVFALVAFCLAGPCRWYVRENLPGDRRQLLKQTLAVLLGVCIPLSIGLLLVTGLFQYYDHFTLGMILGYLWTILFETRVLPERLQSLPR